MMGMTFLEGVLIAEVASGIPYRAVRTKCELMMWKIAPDGVLTAEVHLTD